MVYNKYIIYFTEAVELKIIGLCGGSGSGKGTVAKMFSEFNISSIDTDKVYHMLTSGKSPCLDALVSEFGKEILSEDGSLNRKKLAQIVFSGEDSENKRLILNRISHRFVLDKTREMLADFKKQGIPAAIVDAPLLFESGFDAECDVVIAVTADEDIRVARIAERDGITADSARARIKTQLSDEYLIEHSDYVIDNSGKVTDTGLRVAEIADKILSLGGE